MESFWLPRWQNFGWTTRPLGVPEEIAGCMTLAAFMDVDQQSLDGVRAATGWHESLLVWEKELRGDRLSRQRQLTRPARLAR